MSISTYTGYNGLITFDMIHLSPAVQSIGKRLWSLWLPLVKKANFDSFDTNRAANVCFFIASTISYELIVNKDHPHMTAFADFMTTVEPLREDKREPILVNGTQYQYPRKFTGTDDELTALFDAYLVTVNQEVYQAWLAGYDRANAIVKPEIDLTRGLSDDDKETMTDDEKKNTNKSATS